MVSIACTLGIIRGSLYEITCFMASDGRKMNMTNPKSRAAQFAYFYPSIIQQTVLTQEEFYKRNKISTFYYSVFLVNHGHVQDFHSRLSSCLCSDKV